MAITASFLVPFESSVNRLTKGQDTRHNRGFSFGGTETVEQQSSGRIGAAGRHTFGGVLCIYTEGERKPPSEPDLCARIERLNFGLRTDVRKIGTNLIRIKAVNSRSKRIGNKESRLWACEARF